MVLGQALEQKPSIELSRRMKKLLDTIAAANRHYDRMEPRGFLVTKKRIYESTNSTKTRNEKQCKCQPSSASLFFVLSYFRAFVIAFGLWAVPTLSAQLFQNHGAFAALDKSHRRTLVSCAPLATELPSGLNWMALTGPRWPMNVPNAFLVAVS